ncbi:MAG: inositol monophosphatase family protein, partial [Pseudomonadota bacterium]
MRDVPIDASVAVETAHALADAAREAILPLFRDSALVAEDKSRLKAAAGFDPVTQADRAAEKAMREVLKARRPQDGVLGEEFEPWPSRSGLTWVLDPIDGTRAFMAGTPTWGVLIALSDQTGPIYGLIDQPYIGERFEGGLGRSWFSGPQGNGTLGTLGNRPLSQSILFTTYPEVGTAREAEAFAAVARDVRLTRYGI